MEKLLINYFHTSCALHEELGYSIAFHACDLMSESPITMRTKLQWLTCGLPIIFSVN